MQRPLSRLRGAVPPGGRRRQVRRAIVPLVAALAVALTVVVIRSSTSPQEAADATRQQAWRPAAGSPLSPRGGSTMVPVGGDVVVLGGTETFCPPNASCAFAPEAVLDDGAVYAPARDVWRRIARAPVALTNISAAASGTSVYVLTRPVPGSGPPQQFWEYSLPGDRWTRWPAPPHRMDRLVPAGADRLVAYVTAHPGAWTADQSYDIASHTWSSVPRDPLAPSEDRNLVATESGDLVLLAVDSPWQPGEPSYPPWRAARRDAGTGLWTEIPTPGIVDSEPTWWWVAGRVVNPATETVEEGGRSAGTGGILDPAGGTWQPVPPQPADPDGAYPWLRIVGSGRVFVRGQVLDVRSGTWTAAPRPPARFPTQDEAAVIVDDRVVVFGGVVDVATGGTLTSDTWILRLPPAPTP